MINVEIKNEPTKKVESFPKLMINKKYNCIILMTYYDKGVVLQQGESQKRVGYMSREWEIDKLTDYHGEVTISNRNSQVN